MRIWSKPIAIIARHGTVEATRERAADYARRAIEALAVFPAGAMRSALEEAALFAVARRY